MSQPIINFNKSTTTHSPNSVNYRLHMPNTFENLNNQHNQLYLSNYSYDVMEKGNLFHIPIYAYNRYCMDGLSHFDSNQFDSNHFDSNHFDSKQFDIENKPDHIIINMIDYLDYYYDNNSTACILPFANNSTACILPFANKAKKSNNNFTNYIINIINKNHKVADTLIKSINSIITCITPTEYENSQVINDIIPICDIV